MFNVCCFMFAWGCLELVRILVLTSTRWMRCSEQDTVEKACELEHETKKKQEMIEEPNKNEKTCRFGHDIPEGSVGPRIIGKGFRQPTRPCGWDRRWVGFLVCCLAFAPASAAAIPHLEEAEAQRHLPLGCIKPKPSGLLPPCLERCRHGCS